MPFAEGENVGPYRILEKLGQGGMATVYKAYHAGLDRYVALKVLHPDLTGDPSFTVRFQREARLVARLEHPNIVPVHDFSEHERHPYLVMKFIEGETLKARLGRGPLASGEINDIIETVGSALTHAHREGILHRDVKPSNVLIARDGKVYLADFGLARMTQASESTISTDSVMGTPQYISPEQAIGKGELDEGTDIYSFGVMIYEMVVGHVPFSADTPFAIILDHISSPLPLPRAVNPEVPESVERVLLKALAKERADRYATVAEMIAAFKSAWEEAGVPMQGTIIQLPVQPPGGKTPAKDRPPASTPRKTPAKRRFPSRPWIFAGIGGLLVCCLAVAVPSLPGLLAWFRTGGFFPSPTVTPAPSPLPTAEGITYCTGEQTWLRRGYFPTQEIRHCWAQEHFVTDLAYDDGEWLLVMTKDTGYTDQIYLRGADFPADQISENREGGFDITSIAYANDEWVVVMSAGAGLGGQNYLSSPDFPETEIRNYWDQGYWITSAGYGDGLWLIVMSDGPVYENQAYVSGSAFPEDDLRQYWDEDYDITSVVYGGTSWLVVLTKGDLFSNQYYYHQDEFPADGIQEDWDDDYSITNLARGGSLWIVVMSKP